jgi:hypothetical protein
MLGLVKHLSARRPNPGSVDTHVSISTHVLEHVGIPRYDPANELHREIAEVGRSARETGAAD